MPHAHATDAKPTPARETDNPMRRSEPRLKLPAMYTLVRVRLPHEAHYRWTGHIYDISLDGMRFELDEPLEAGTAVEVRVMLPGRRHTLFRAAGSIVRQHDDHPEIAPVRLAMRFEGFGNSVDHYRLANYLAAAGLKRRAEAAPPQPRPMPAPRRPAA